MSSYNYPPGITYIPGEDYEPECGAFSPDGAYRCNAPLDHHFELHAERAIMRVWEFIGKEDAEHFGFTEGELCDLPEFTMPPTITLARWPRRYNDFDENGEPTPRACPIEWRDG